MIFEHAENGCLEAGVRLKLKLQRRLFEAMEGGPNEENAMQ